MKTASWFKLLMMGIVASSLTFVACGDKDNDGDAGDADSTDAMHTSEAGGAEGELKDAMVELSKNMYDLIDDVESVEDVEKIDGDIGKIFDDLVENLKGAMDDPTALQNMGTTMQNDPEVQEWSKKVEDKMNSLKAEHPEAAAKLEEVVNKHSMKLMALMQEAMSKAMQDMAADSGAAMGGAEAPATGDSGAVDNPGN